MLNALVIFIGGGLGSMLRYFVSVLLRNYSFNLPLATFSVNIIGSLVLGFTAALFWRQTHLHPTIRLAIVVGFCGGLTTFSSFSWETFEMLKNGEFLLALLYTTISVLTCVLAVSLGVFLSKYV